MISTAKLAQALRTDWEFGYASRHWTATVQLGVGAHWHRLEFDNGSLESASSAREGQADLVLCGPEEEWRELLRETPRPFYQDPVFASLHHGLTLEPPLGEWAAYYPALRRLIEVMRAALAQGSGSEAAATAEESA